METTTLGRTNITVSRLCIGTWQASGWASSNDARFVETLRHALSRGINFIDTAEAYGDGKSEELIAQAIEGRREGVIIATKFSHTQSAPANVRMSLERSLRRLKTDYVDLFQQHWPPKSPALEETISALEQLKQEGKIRALGVSNWMEPEWRELKNPGRIDSLQPCYNLLWRSIESAVLPLCRAHRIAILPYSPLCQGFLSGRFRSLESIPADWRRKNRYATPETFPKVLAVLDCLSELAERYHKTLAQVALRWLLDIDGVTAPIVGASCPEQVDENIGALGWSLTPEDHLKLSKQSAALSLTIGPHESLWNWHPRAL